MENIFDNACLGKPYKTANDRKAVYLRDFNCNGMYHLLSTGDTEFAVNNDGKVDKMIYPFGVDIVSEWKEEIDDTELNRLANEWADEHLYRLDSIREYAMQDFKEGYRKALERV